jgi:hypothetical protein
MEEIKTISLFNKEISLVKTLKSNPQDEFSISKQTSQIFRDVLSLKYHLITMDNNNFSNKIFQVNLMVNFVIDTITQLYQQVLQFHTYDIDHKKYEINYKKDENEQTLKIIDKYLYTICNEKNLEKTKKLINLCFKKNFLKINLDFEISYPRFKLLEYTGPNNISPSDHKDLNEIIVSYADYIKEDYSFMGHADLNILSSLPIFKGHSQKIEKALIAQYSQEKAHIGGGKIKSDGNCLLSCFIFEYLNKFIFDSLDKIEIEKNNESLP